MSTDAQLKGDSLRRQLEISRAYAAEMELTLVEDVRLHDIGVSAFQGENVDSGALGRFVDLVKKGEVERGSYLLVESLDRITRQNPQRATLFFLQILELGIHVVTLGDGRLYQAGEGNFNDLIYSVVVLSRAHEESVMKSQRVGAAWKNKRNKAATEKLTRIAPAWLSLSEDRLDFLVDEPKAALVQRIFDDAEAGKGAFQIARQFNGEGVEPLGDSKGWHESYVTRILTNRAVIGEFQPHRYVGRKRVPDGPPIADYFPRIVELDQYLRVQAGRLARKNRGSGRKGKANTNLFSQVARCGYCAGRIYLVDKGPKPKGGVYLRCDNARRGTGCSASGWPLAHFEPAFLTFVSEIDVRAIIDEPSRLEDARNAQARITVLEAELERNQRLREGAIELLGMETVDVGFVRDKLNQYSAAIAQVADEIASLRRELAVPVEKKMLAAEEALGLISRASLGNPSASEARVRIADWIRLNVKELLLFSDGIEEDHQANLADKKRQFSVLFESGVFRLVECRGPDPASYTFNIVAYGDEWSETLPNNI
jgi:DNA invertase Pin-like site-specific DNA recombinase